MCCIALSDIDLWRTKFEIGKRWKKETYIISTNCYISNPYLVTAGYTTALVERKEARLIYITLASTKGLGKLNVPSSHLNYSDGKAPL